MTRPVHAPMVRETSTTTGTGTYDLAGAATGFQTFVAGVGNGATCYYSATDGTDWEIGIGTVTDATPDTLARTTILESSNAGAAVNWGAGTRTLRCSLPHLGMLPPGHIFGLGLSNAADADHDITIAAGSARDEDDTVDMVLPAAITKQIDAGWAVGTGAGGINTGAVANTTWYEVLLIMRTDTGVVDVMFSTTANRATLPTSYTKFRRIGWVRSNGSANLLAFTQSDDHFTLTTQINDVAAATSTTAAAVALTVPPSSIARFRAALVVGGNNANALVFSEIVEGDVTPASSTGIASLAMASGTSMTGDVAGHFELRVSSTSTIEWDAATTDGSFDISTFGWIDHRGRLSGT